MGKKAKGRRHDEKMKKKRALKDQRKADYASLAGTSKKSKKRNARLKKGCKVLNTYSPTKHKHRIDRCGNPGCKRCGG